MCSTSLKAITNASSNQVAAAVAYNRDQINTLLIQLLAINVISTNQQQIENELKTLEIDNICSNNESSIKSDFVSGQHHQHHKKELNQTNYNNTVKINC